MNRKNRWGRALAALGLLTSSAGVALLVTVPAADAAGELHSYVCKYKVTPGGGEVLQSGQNPIWPSNAALGVDTVEPGQKFNDAQGFSIALLDPQYLNLSQQVNPEPSVDLCKEAPQEAIPAAPTFVDPTCDGDAQLNLPALNEGVASYDVTGTVAPGESVTVTAVAADGYDFAEGTTIVWEHTFADAPADEVCDPPTEARAVEPSYTEADCDVPAGLQLPTTEGVTYTVEGTVAPGETVTITATAQEGFVLVGDTVFEHTYSGIGGVCGPKAPPVVDPPVVTPPVVTPPVVNPPVAGPPAPPSVVTPTVVHAGMVDQAAGVAGSVEESIRLVGTGLTGAGLLLLLGGGATWLRRDGGEA